MLALALAPTRLSPLSTEHPAVLDRSRRRPRGPGCGLDQVASSDGCRHVEVSAVRDEEISFPSSIPEKGVVALRGTVSVPDLPARRPAVVLLHGSGPQDRNAAAPGDLVSTVEPPFEILRALADFFAREGLIVLRWDKRGPKLYPELATDEHDAKFRFSDFERDARDAIAYLAKRPDVDPDAILVAGHSEGGAVAAHVAAAEPSVAAVILLGAFLDVFDAGAWQIKNHARTRLRQADAFGYVALSLLARSQRRCIDKLQTAYDPTERCLARNVTQALLKDVIEYEAHTMERLASLERPIMALQGSVDRNIDPTTLPRLGEALGGRDLELHYVPRVNHLLVDAIEPKHPPELDAQVKERLRSFLTSVTRR